MSMKKAPQSLGMSSQRNADDGDSNQKEGKEGGAPRHEDILDQLSLFCHEDTKQLRGVLLTTPPRGRHYSQQKLGRLLTGSRILLAEL